MNIKEISINELEIPSIYMEEAISALLHTILFVRAPNLIKPEDYQCKLLAPLMFAKCEPKYVDQTVKDTIVILSRVQVPLSPGRYGGVVNVSFFEMKTRKAYLGFTSYQEKVYFERWTIPIIVNENNYLSPKEFYPAMNVATAITANPSMIQPPMNTMENEVILKIGVEEIIRGTVQNRIAMILEAGNSSVDHIPFTSYEYDIEVNGMDLNSGTTTNNPRSSSI